MVRCVQRQYAPFLNFPFSLSLFSLAPLLRAREFLLHPLFKSLPLVQNNKHKLIQTCKWRILFYLHLSVTTEFEFKCVFFFTCGHFVKEPILVYYRNKSALTPIYKMKSTDAIERPRSYNSPSPLEHQAHHTQLFHAWRLFS